MPIDLYGQKPLEALKGTVSRQAEFGKNITQQMFSNVPKGRIEPQLTRYKGHINDAIQAWGIDNIIKWNENGAELTQAIEQDLQLARQELMKARAKRDMDTYKQTLDRILFDKTMKQYADMLNNASIGNIITAIIGGLGQIGAWWLGEKKNKREMKGVNEAVKKYYEPIQNYLDIIRNTPIPTIPYSHTYINAPGLYSFPKGTK